MSAPIRWLVMATAVPPGGSLGGVVRYTTEFMIALAERDDVVVSALTTRAAADTVRELIGGGQVRSIPGGPVPLLSLVERHGPISALRRGPDVVHGVKHLVPRRSEALRVLTVHDMLLLDRSSDFGLGKRLLLPPPYRASIRQADLLLCVSEATRRRLATQAPGAQGRAEVVHLATSTALRSSAPVPVPQLAGRRFALVVGDQSPRKNVGTVVAAWPAVVRRHPDAVLAVAGPPNWGRTEVGPLYGSLVAAGSLLPLGSIDDGQLRWAYENATAVLCPSLAEGFGLPAVEALEFGAPVLVSDDPALVEVSTGRARAVLPALSVQAWSQAVGEVLDRPARTAAIGGRTWAQVVEESVQAVRKALTRRHPVRPSLSRGR